LPNHKLNEASNSTYYGHAGDTYGFQSTQGFFKTLNVSMSLTTNEDFTSSHYSVFCLALQVVFKYKNVTEELKCEELTKPNFKCYGFGDDAVPRCHSSRLNPG
jgi:hypothetical protein